MKIEDETLGDANPTYELEQHTKQNQRVLGLKYIHDRYGHPRRRLMQPNKPRITSMRYPGITVVKKQSEEPPGLDAQRGKPSPVAPFTKSYLSEYQHHRLHNSQKENVNGDYNGDKVKGTQN
jgi:hypothetical protein